MTYAKTLCGKIQFTNLLSGGNAYNYLSALNVEIGRVCIKYEKEERCTHGSGGETWEKETTWKTEAKMGR